MRFITDSEHGPRIAEAAEDAPAEGEALFTAELAVVTRADLARGGDERPRVPGRAALGVRDADGARVVVAPDHVCGRCPRCRAGLGAHCESRVTLGEPGQPGALAERLVLPTRQLIPVPDHLEPEHAALAVLAAAALQAAARLHVRETPYATVIGAGAEAVLAAQALAADSATVRVLSDSQGTLDACEKRGLRSRPTPEAGRRADQDVVVVCPPGPRASENPLETALEMAAPRGRVVVTPGAPREARNLHLVAERELDLLGSRWAPLAEAVDALATGAIDASGLITKRVKFDHAPAALAALPGADELALAVDFA